MPQYSVIYGIHCSEATNIQLYIVISITVSELQFCNTISTLQHNSSYNTRTLHQYTLYKFIHNPNYADTSLYHVHWVHSDTTHGTMKASTETPSIVLAMHCCNFRMVVRGCYRISSAYFQNLSNLVTKHVVHFSASTSDY